MHQQIPEPARPQLAPREETWLVSERAAATWTTSRSQFVWAPVVISNPALAECICPDYCIRDHETD